MHPIYKHEIRAHPARHHGARRFRGAAACHAAGRDRSAPNLGGSRTATKVVRPAIYMLIASHLAVQASSRLLNRWHSLPPKKGPGWGHPEPLVGIVLPSPSDDIEVVQHEHRCKNEKDRLSNDNHRASYCRCFTPGQIGPKKKAPGDDRRQRPLRIENHATQLTLARSRLSRCHRH
jgi:hypothetical protein